MGFFDGLFKSISQYVRWDFKLDQALSAFRSDLNDGSNPRIRMWVAGSPGYGHQSASVAILRQIVNPALLENGFGYAGIIDVYYEKEKGGETTLAKLYKLLPELGGQPSGQVGNATVNLILWADQNIAQEVSLGLTGGADEEGTGGPDFAARLNTTYFLRLQPYRWGAPEQLQIKAQPKGTLTLTKERVLGLSTFTDRAFYQFMPVPVPVWNSYQGTAAEQAAVVRLATTTGGLAQVPVYSIRSQGNLELAAPAVERMFNVLTAVLASQKSGNGTAAGALPTMILSCDAFGDDDLISPTFQSLIDGGPSSAETKWLAQVNTGEDMFGFKVPEKELKLLKTLLASHTNRAAYLKTVDAENRVKIVWNATLQNVQAEMNWLMADRTRVLFVQIGRMPGTLFDYLMQQTTLFPVFEGQNTANLLFNIGNPYFHVARPSSYDTQYPTTLVNYEDYARIDTDAPMMPVIFVPQEPALLQKAANNVNYALQVWPAKAAENPAELIGAFIRAFQAEDGSGKYHSYFKAIKQFYQTPPNDKLRYGVAFLNYIRGTLEGNRLALAEGEPALDALYASLLQNTTPEGTLDLVPGVFASGSIFELYKGLVAAGQVLVSGAKITKQTEAGKTLSVQAQGGTDAFGATMGVTFDFTARGTVVTADARFTYVETWAPPELPWLRFKDPFVELSTIDADMPTVGKIGGTIESAGVTVGIKLPVEDGQWQLEGSFVKPYPSIAKFYALAGGADLTQSLPSPFNGLAGLGVSALQLAFDSKRSTVKYVGVAVQTQSTFDLLPGLTVNRIGAQVTVHYPAGADRSVDWQVQGAVKIGSRPDAGVVVLGAVGPVLKLDGQLVSGDLRLSDLFSVFLPGLDFQPQKEPAITEFLASFTPSLGDYSFQCKLNIDYSISVIGRQIVLQSLTLSGSRTKALVLGFIGGVITIPAAAGGDPFDLSMSATYDGTQWVFSAAQTGAPLSLTALFNAFLPEGWKIDAEYALDGLSMTIALGDSSYAFAGRTAEKWAVPFIDGLSVSADVRAGYVAKATPERPAGAFGRIGTEWTWQNIDIQVWYDYSPTVKKFGITWGVLEGVVSGPDPVTKDYTASLGFTENVTVGYLIETMVSWMTGSKFGLDSPWDILDRIPLGGLSLIYTFNTVDPTRNKVSFGVKIGPIDLGFARIDGIQVGYQSTGPDRGVMVSLTGSFPWNVGDAALGDTGALGPWDASQPGSAPAPAGNGNKYLDLRMLAMGQHVTAPCLATATSVQKAVACLATLPDTKPGEIPPIQFDAQSSWLFGADFGVLKIDPAQNGGKPGYFLTVQTVFNDPVLYGLRIALDGPAAKVFKGLDFQIMYRQVSPTVGVYQAEITLPDVMRYIQAGAYSITLPVFGVSIYTNGDFLIDIGFPYNADFSRSFSVEAIIYPGIPLLGSGGLYFGKLSSASTTLVPQADNGTFNPVIVFGFGLQVGFGKSIRYGVLSAGFSLTVAGILEGVIGKWNPYQGSGDSGTGNQLQGSYYFWLRGTVGILGNLFGSVDFAIVKASVNVDIKLMVQLTYESFVSIALTVIVSVDASASIEINLGLFKIKISFSFSLKVKESFAIDNLGTPPWHVPGARSLLRRPADARLRAAREALAARSSALRLPQATPAWSNLLAPATPAPLSGYLAPGLTMAADEWKTTPDLASQTPCYVAMLFLDSTPSIHDFLARRARGALSAGQDTSFEALAKMILRWAVAALQAAPLTAAQVDALPVRVEDLERLLDSVLASTNDNPTPLPTGDIETFLQRQFKLSLCLPPASGAPADGAYFPVPGALTLTIPAYGAAYPGASYAFGGYNEVSADTLKALRAYFDELAVKVSDESSPQGARALLSQAATVSMSEWVFSDYFLLIARQMTQAVRESLRTFKMTVPSGKSARDMVGWINTTGQLSGTEAYSVLDLFAANLTHPLSPGKSWTIEATLAAGATDTFTSIAAKALFAGAFTAAALATENAGSPVLAVGQKIRYPSKPDYTTLPSDTLAKVASALGVSLADLLSNTPALTQAGLLAPVALLALPVFKAAAEDGDTLLALGARFGVSVDDLAAQADNEAIVDPFSSSVPALDVPHLAQFPVGELLSEVQATGGLTQLSAMVSRYHLHGMRLPTSGITPKQQGLWVRVAEGSGEADKLVLPPEAGLFALTGQAFALPDIQAPDAFSFTLDGSGGPPWITLLDGAGKPTSKLTVKVDPAGTDAARIRAIAAYARSTRLDVTTTALGPGGMVQSDLASYPFTSSSIWQAAAAIALPYGAPTAGIPALAILPLPDALAALPDPDTHLVAPRVALRTARYDEATGSTVTSDVASYGFATVIPFTVKRVPEVPGAKATASTYEVVGAGGGDVVTLERLVQATRGDDAAIDSLILGYAPDQTGPKTKGIQTDDPAFVTFGIAQVNLSTVTRPTGDRLAAVAPPAVTSLNRPSELVQLLWEATITQNGGFFLYYFDGNAKSGLPGRIFNDKDEATLTLVVVHARPSGAPQQNRLDSSMNAVVIGGAIESRSTVVFAVADPPSAPLPPDTVIAGPDQTLSSLATGSYSDLGDLASANAGLSLAAGEPLLVTRGLYQAPLGGIRLSDLAARFGTTVAALNAANPKWQGALPDPLVFPTAVRLPELTLASGSSPETATLADAAAFVSQDLTSLAADNAETPGLFATGQTIVLPGGPRLRRATVPAGAEGVLVRRPRPDDVPDDPSAPDFARLFLLHDFSLLDQRISPTVDFVGTHVGLPAGPATVPDDPTSMDKVRGPREVAPGEPWTYRQAFPYSRFVAPSALARPAPHAAPRGAQDNPYSGVGGLLQVGFGWLDYYGNRIVTTLSDPAPGDAGPTNQAPTLVGYTDALIGLGQWPQIVASYLVGPDPKTAAPAVLLGLTFDKSAYEGVLSAQAVSGSQVVVALTQPADPQSAGAIANYTLDGNARVTSASLGGDGRTVTLGVSGLASGNAYTLLVSGVKDATGSGAVSGQAGFAYPDDPAARTSTVQSNAARDLRIWSALYLQLEDPLGVSLSVESTLFAGALPLTADQLQALTDWLFGAPPSIVALLDDRSRFGTTAPAPAASMQVALPLASVSLNTAQIYPLSLSFVLARKGGLVLGDLAATPGIREIATRVLPATDSLTGSATLGLVRFATSFQDTLSVKGRTLCKIATGNDRGKPPRTQGTGVWVVRVGQTLSDPISFAIATTSEEAPLQLAPRPISNRLESRPSIAIHDYATGTGISPAPTRTLDFSNIDMDVWGRQVFAAVDGLLSPAFTASTQIVGSLVKVDYLKQLLAAKATFADLVKDWMVPVFAGETGDSTGAREAFRQSLLERLGNAYSVAAGVQVTAAVNANVDDPLAKEPPRLHGGVQVREGTPVPARSQVAFTSPKLTLATQGAAPLAFLLSAPDVVLGEDGEVVSSLDMDLVYSGSTIEHQIGAPSGPDDAYVASSWLRFVVEDAAPPWTQDIGPVSVPLPLRAFPATPTLVEQTATPEGGGTDLAALLAYHYDVTYTLPFHYPQDRVHGTVEWNVAPSLSMLAGFEDAFPAMAQFVTVVPAVQADLTALLATIDATIDPVADKAKIDDAAVALASFLELSNDLLDAARSSGLALTSSRRAGGSPALTYAFTLEESFVAVGEDPAALLVTLVGDVPSGMGTPVVDIEPATYEAVPPPVTPPVAGQTSYVYRLRGSDPAKYLPAADGQAISARTLRLPGLDILQRQSAKTTVYIERNRDLVRGKVTADPFVYQTSDVSFPEPLTPQIVSETPVDIAKIGSPPSPRSLADHLTALFAALLANNTEPTLTLQVVTTYDQSLHPSLSAVTLPVMMQAPLSVAVTGSGAGTLAQMILDWSEAITLYFDAHAPASHGTLRFDLRVFSNLTKTPLPLVRLEDLFLAATSITPPLRSIAKARSSMR